MTFDHHAGVVGTDAAGTAPLGNLRGVWISGGDGNLVGGAGPAFGNLISGNGGAGVLVDTGQNRIAGNRIGTDLGGKYVLVVSADGVVERRYLDVVLFVLTVGLPAALILDLEDSVPPAEKDAARMLVRNALVAMDWGSSERMVRVNQGDSGWDDLDEAVAVGGPVRAVAIPHLDLRFGGAAAAPLARAAACSRAGRRCAARAAGRYSPPPTGHRSRACGSRRC